MTTNAAFENLSFSSFLRIRFPFLFILKSKVYGTGSIRAFGYVKVSKRKNCRDIREGEGENSFREKFSGIGSKVI